MGKEFMQYRSPKEWEYAFRKRFEERFHGAFLRCHNENVSDDDFYIKASVFNDYIYKIYIRTNDFIPSEADPIDADAYIEIVRIDTYDEIFVTKEFDNIEEAIAYMS